MKLQVIAAFALLYFAAESSAADCSGMARGGPAYQSCKIIEEDLARKREEELQRKNLDSGTANTAKTAGPKGHVQGSRAELESRLAPADLQDAEAKPPRKGDEWEYASIDMFGKKQVLIARVLETNSTEGIVEEFGMRRGTLQEFSFGRQPTVVFNGSNSIVWFSPYWDGKQIGTASVLNKEYCTNLQYISGCTVTRAEKLGIERVSVPAGSFNTARLRVEIDLQSQYGSARLILNAWYSNQEQRIVKQTIVGFHAVTEGWPNAVNDRVELVAIRRAK